MNDGQTSTEIPGVAINNSKFLENLDFPAPCENAEVTGGSTTPDMNERQADYYSYSYFLWSVRHLLLHL